MKKLFALIMTIVIAVACTSMLVACNKDDGNSKTIKETANELLADLKSSGELDNIINSFFNGTATFTYTNPVDTLPTDHSKYLIVATNAYFPPFEYYDGDKFTGIDMQIASLLAEKLGKTLYILDEDFDAIIPSITTGQADIGMAGMTVNETRKKVVDFTNEYYESAQVIMVLESDTTFDDCSTAADIEAKLSSFNKSYKIGAQSGTTGYMYSAGDEDFGYDGFANLTVSQYSNGALAAQDLKNGKINAVVIDKQPALMIAKSLGGIKVYDKLDLTAESYAFAVKKG